MRQEGAAPELPDAGRSRSPPDPGPGRTPRPRCSDPRPRLPPRPASRPQTVTMAVMKCGDSEFQRHVVREASPLGPDEVSVKTTHVRATELLRTDGACANPGRRRAQCGLCHTDLSLARNQARGGTPPARAFACHKTVKRGSPRAPAARPRSGRPSRPPPTRSWAATRLSASSRPSARAWPASSQATASASASSAAAAGRARAAWLARTTSAQASSAPAAAAAGAASLPACASPPTSRSRRARGHPCCQSLTLSLALHLNPPTTSA